VIKIDLTVGFGKVGYHSGEAGGIIPETFRIIRELLDRIENSDNGNVIEELRIEPPESKKKEAEHIAKNYAESFLAQYNDIVPGGIIMNKDNVAEAYLNRAWYPNMSITGAAGLPPLASAGNVLRPSTTVRISMRIPPGMDGHKAKDIIVKKLTENPPYNATVEA
jgi:hypothetical protein